MKWKYFLSKRQLWNIRKLLRIILISFCMWEFFCLKIWFVVLIKHFVLFIYHDKAPQKKSALILMWKIALTSPPTQLSARFRNQQRFYLNCRVKFFEGKIFVWKVLRSFKMWIRVWRKKDCDIFYSFVVTLPSDDNISLLRKKSEDTWILKPIWKKDG